LGQGLGENAVGFFAHGGSSGEGEKAGILASLRSGCDVSCQTGRIRAFASVGADPQLTEIAQSKVCTGATSGAHGC